MREFVLVVLAAACSATSLAGQGTLSGQGFGYPVNGQSARSAGTAGALAPFDELTPLNPAAVANWQRGALYFHAEPESRTTRLGSARDRTSVVRFPLSGVSGKVSQRASVALTFATLLDRTFETASRVQERVGEDLVDVTSLFASSGAITDVRAALGWRFSDRLRGGAGLHFITGGNRLAIGRDFPDTVPLADVSSQASYAFSGQAVSFGVDWRVLPKVAVTAHTRVGGAMRARLADTLVGSATVPLQVGGGVRYDGIASTVIAASWQRTRWTDMAGLGSASLAIRDADEFAVGVESRGPTVFGSAVTLRLGARQRTLPFDIGTQAISERSFAGGVGYPLSLGRASLNLGVQRASRSGGGARETAWLTNFGLAIVP
jgi:hypothetical protein